MNELLIKTILVGIFTGIIGSFFGILGSSILLPSLLFFGIVKDYDTAIGTILLILMLPTTLLGVYEYNKRKQVNYEVGIILFITYFFSSYIGSYFNKFFHQKILLYGCATLYLFITMFFFIMLTMRKNK
jgi:uncharacterized membrane protein YfcA